MNGIYEEIRLALHGIWQRRWLALMVAWGVAVLGWIVIALIPNSYESRSRIYIQTDSVLTNEMGITEREQRLQIDRIRQTLASTDNLEKVVRETELASDAASDEQVRALASQLRDKVSVVAQQSPDQSINQGNMFEIVTTWSSGGFADARSARLAREINEELLDALVEANLSGSRAEATSSVEFLDRQITEREQQLRELETRRNAFEESLSGLLPGTGTISERVNQARAELRNVEADFAAAQSSMAAVQSQLNSTSATVSVPGGYSAGPGPATARLNALQQQLSEAQGRGWTDQHPDVVALRSQIARARSQARGEPSGGGGGGATASNPLYTSLQSMAADRQSQVASLSAQRDRLRMALEQVQRREATDPAALAEQQQIDRDYEAARVQYNELVSDRERVRLRGDVATSSEASQFRVVDPPSMPKVPATPNRPLLLVAVLFASIAAGIGAAFGMSQIRAGYPTAPRLRAQTGLPVLGSIGVFSRPAQIAEAKRMFRRFATAGGALVAVFALLMVAEFVKRGLVA